MGKVPYGRKQMAQTKRGDRREFIEVVIYRDMGSIKESQQTSLDNKKGKLLQPLDLKMSEERWVYLNPEKTAVYLGPPQQLWAFGRGRGAAFR